MKSVGDKRLTSTCHNLDIIKLNFIGHPDLVRGKACVTAAAIDTGPQLRVDWGLVGCGVTAAAAFSIMKAVWLHFSHLPTYIARSTNLNIAHLYKTRVFAASDCWIEKPQRLLRPKGGRGGWMKASKEENVGFYWLTLQWKIPKSIIVVVNTTLLFVWLHTAFFSFMLYC